MHTISYFYFDVKLKDMDDFFEKKNIYTIETNIISYLIMYRVIRYHNFGAVDLHLSTKDYYPRLD